jgi:hypothetical protein
MTNQPPNVPDLMKELLKNYGQEYGVDDTNVDMFANIASSFLPNVNQQPPNVSASTSTEPKSATTNSVPSNPASFSTNDNMNSDPLNGLNSVLNMLNTMSNLPTNTPRPSESKVSINKSPYHLVNTLYNTLWNQSELTSLEKMYHPDATLSLTSKVDESNKWEIQSREKVMEYYQKLWLPYVRNQETFVEHFEFKMTDSMEDCDETCTVSYSILQKQMDLKTMSWRNYYIQMNDTFTLMHDTKQILAHNMTINVREQRNDLNH